MLLNALLGQRTLDIFVVILGIGTSDLVFIDTRGSLLKEVAARTTEYGRIPVRPPILRSKDEDRGVGLGAWGCEFEDGGETQRKQVVIPFICQC